MIFSGNTAATAGGAILVSTQACAGLASAATDCPIAWVDNSAASFVFERNHAGVSGGAIYVECDSVPTGCMSGAMLERDIGYPFSTASAGGLPRKVRAVIFSENTAGWSGQDIASLPARLAWPGAAL